MKPKAESPPAPTSTPALTQISLNVLAEAEEAVADLFERVLNQPPVLYTDNETQVTTVSAFLQAPQRWTPDLERRIRLGIREIRTFGLAVGHGRLRVRRLPPTEWAQAWKRHFKPFTVGNRLLIRPSWSQRSPRRGQAVVELDPGLSFGTGHHPTTLFCLRQLVARLSPDSKLSLLDVGSGSGILAIAGAKLGYHPIVAFDIDPVAVRVARANARRNRVLHRISLSQADLSRMPAPSGAPFDVLCANLLAELLIQERHRLARWIKPHGHLLLAGILTRQYPDVQRAFAQIQFRPTAVERVKEWTSAAFSAFS
ncbi:MAG TPA: 50S ribosomal protein L11 methyltransferase [Verrucomicrobiota bacterium]|nr:50S ribosomal protein L11 methyltransferase [Verrucomicrobiota bacterium]HNU51216.1 50S ribosomal protein L11 methyltransferase [Verrucomicrobiota bacterium]